LLFIVNFLFILKQSQVGQSGQWPHTNSHGCNALLLFITC